MLKYEQQKCHQIGLFCLALLSLVIQIAAGVFQTIMKANGFISSSSIPTNCLTPSLRLIQKSVLLLRISSICIILALISIISFLGILILRFCKQISELRKDKNQRKVNQVNQNNENGEQLMQQASPIDQFFNLFMLQFSIVLTLLALFFILLHFGLTLSIFIIQRLCKVNSNIGLLIPAAQSFCSLILLIIACIILLILRKKMNNSQNEKVALLENNEKKQGSQVGDGNVVEMQDTNKIVNLPNQKQNQLEEGQQKKNQFNQEEGKQQKIKNKKRQRVKQKLSLKETEFNDGIGSIWQSDAQKIGDYNELDVTFTRSTRRPKKVNKQPIKLLRSPIQQYIREDEKPKRKFKLSESSKNKSSGYNEGDSSMEVPNDEKEFKGSLWEKKLLEEQQKYLTSINGKEKTRRELLNEKEQNDVPRENLHRNLKKKLFSQPGKSSENPKSERKTNRGMKIADHIRSRYNY